MQRHLSARPEIVVPGSVKRTSGSHWIVTAEQPDPANEEEMSVGQRTDGLSIIGIFSGRGATATSV
jgi:hypothetical protein